MDKKPLVINFFAGPGAGKSTTSALVFGYLKQRGFNIELVTEYAKELVWEDRNKTLNNQIYLLGKQSNRIDVLAGQVDAIITDSPIMLCSIYRANHYPECFDQLVKWKFDQYDNINFFLNRKKPFNPKGRIHTLEESIEADNIIRSMLDRNDIEYDLIDGDEFGVRFIQETVENYLNTVKGEKEI